MQIHRTNFQSRNNYFWKVPILHIIQNHWKKTSSITSSSVFNLTLEHIQLDNFCLWNCLWTSNAYRLVAQKLFLLQMLGEASIFTLPGNVPLWEKSQNVLCDNMHMDVSPYILKFKFFSKNTCPTMTAWNHIGLL